MKEKIKKAIELGNIIFSKKAKKAIESLDLNNLNYTLINAKLDSAWGPWKKINKSGKEVGNDGGIDIHWTTISAGNGRITLYIKDGKLYCESQDMNKEFIKTVLMKLIDEAIIL